MLRFLLCMLLLPAVVQAGRSIPPAEKKKLQKKCSRGDAEACIPLAEETLCGRGWNPTYERYMQKSCRYLKARCAKKNAAACLRLVEVCYVGIHEGPIYDAPKGKDPDVFTYKNSLKYLQKSCSYGSVEGCKRGGLMALKKFERSEQDLDIALRFFNQACDLKDGESCSQLTQVLQQKIKLVQSKACALGHKKSCPEKPASTP